MFRQPLLLAAAAIAAPLSGATYTWDNLVANGSLTLSSGYDLALGTNWVGNTVPVFNNQTELVFTSLPSGNMTDMAGFTTRTLNRLTISSASLPMSLLEWLNDQLLRMEWLHDAVTRLVEGPLGMSTQERMGASVHFFLYDSAKILLLLTAMIFVLSWIQSHFPPERSKALLGTRRGLGAKVFAALLGTVTPFCSCSSIPLFIGFTRAGLPIGVTFAFLISSPLVDLASLVLLAGVFNWTIAFAYVLAGLVLAVFGGILIDGLGMESQLEPLTEETAVGRGQVDLSAGQRVALAWRLTRETVDKVVGYVLIGVGIGALVHNWIPQALIDSLFGDANGWSVLAATLVGIPMYADIFGTLPVAEALVARGVGLGTALALMMSVTALSLPSLILLRRVVRPRLLAVFTAIVAAGILILGYLFNWLAPLLS